MVNKANKASCPDRRGNHVRNTDGLKAHARKKSQDKRKRVHETLDCLAAEGAVVSFLAVSKAAGVARSYLYDQEDIRERIAALIGLGGDTRLRLVSGPAREGARTDRTKDVILEAKNQKIRELSDENKALRDQIKKLNGMLVEGLTTKKG